MQAPDPISLAGTDQPLVRLTGTTNLPTATARHYHQDGLGSVVAVSGPVAATSQNAAREAGASVAQSGVTTLYTIGGVASSPAAAVNGDKKASAGLWCVNSGASLEITFAGKDEKDGVRSCVDTFSVLLNPVTLRRNQRGKVR